MTPEQLKKLDEVYKFMQSMKRFDTIDINTEKALAYRLDTRSAARVRSSAADPATYTQAVDEAGSAQVDTAKPMTGFIEIVDGLGNTHLIPTYD